jgi:hypothetical protein
MERALTFKWVQIRFGFRTAGAYGSKPDYSCEIRDEFSDIEATVITLGGLFLNGHVAC